MCVQGVFIEFCLSSGVTSTPLGSPVDRTRVGIGWKPFRRLRTPSAHPSRGGDWWTHQQHAHCTPGQLDYAVREWVCSAGTYRDATASTADHKSRKSLGNRRNMMQCFGGGGDRLPLWPPTICAQAKQSVRVEWWCRCRVHFRGSEWRLMKLALIAEP